MLETEAAGEARAPGLATGASDAPRLRLHARGFLSEADVAVLGRHLSDDDLWRRLPVIAEARRSCVARLRLPSGPVVVKRYLEPGVFRLRTFARRSRAEREARALDLAASARIDAPVRVMAWAEERRLGCVARSFVVTSELEGSFDLRALKGTVPGAGARALQVVLRELPRQVADLHAAGVRAGTLRGKNVLVQPGRGVVALIDLPYARAPRRFGPRHRIHDLASLSLELRRFLDAEQWRGFLGAYLRHARDLRPAEALRIREERIARLAARLGHRTPLTAAVHALKRRVRHSRPGQWLRGHRYPRGCD